MKLIRDPLRENGADMDSNEVDCGSPLFLPAHHSKMLEFLRH